jgi:hypothetical protein
MEFLEMRRIVDIEADNTEQLDVLREIFRRCINGDIVIRKKRVIGEDVVNNSMELESITISSEDQNSHIRADIYEGYFYLKIDIIDERILKEVKNLWLSLRHDVSENTLNGEDNTDYMTVDVTNVKDDKDLCMISGFVPIFMEVFDNHIDICFNQETVFVAKEPINSVSILDELEYEDMVEEDYNSTDEEDDEGYEGYDF